MGIIIPLSQETSIYKDAISWYYQINEYLKNRNDNSNIFYSAAALWAYEKLGVLAELETGGFEYTTTILEGVLDAAELKKSIFRTFRICRIYRVQKKVEEKKLEIQAGTIEYKIITDGLEAGVAGMYSFTLPLMAACWSDSGFLVLEEMAEVADMAGGFQSAWQCCMFLGCSVGALPMVIDLYDDMFEGVKDNVAASYFISDYYIREKYQNFYAACFDENSFPTKYNISDSMLGSYSNIVEKDPIVYNWCCFMNRKTEDFMRNDCRQLRHDLDNYIATLKYAQEFDASAAKSALVKYISAECNKGKTTEFYTSCPVRVEVYDAETDQLLASLSSEDGSIPACEYATMYLMGENNETKCFVLKEGSYYAKIIPYDDGTMNVGVITSDGTDAAEGKIFTAVSLTTGSEFVLDLNDMESGLNTADGGVIDKDDYVPVTDAEISGATEVAVGAALTLTAKVMPSIATNKSVSWTSSAPSVATVDENGVVTGIAEGSAVITASCEDGVKQEITVSVYIPAESLSVSKEQLTMVSGETFTLMAETTANASHAVSWVSNNINAVTVTENGELYAKAAGDAIVTASIDGIEADACIRVFDTQLSVDMYQCDEDGNAVEIKMANNSCTEAMNKTAYVGVYESGKMIDIQAVTINLACNEEATSIVELPDFADSKTYSAMFYLPSEGESSCVTEEIVFVNGDSDAAVSTAEALGELPETQKITVTCDGMTTGSEYMIYVLTDNTGVPTVDNIAYIKKIQAESAQMSIQVSLAEKYNEKQCYVYVVEANGELKEIGTFTQHEHQFENGKCSVCGYEEGETVVPGDINGDNKVDITDLIRLKKFIADDTTEIIGSADLNGDGIVDILDLIRLKKIIAGETSFS